MSNRANDSISHDCGMKFEDLPNELWIVDCPHLPAPAHLHTSQSVSLSGESLLEYSYTRKSALPGPRSTHTSAMSCLTSLVNTVPFCLVFSLLMPLARSLAAMFFHLMPSLTLRVLYLTSAG